MAYRLEIERIRVAERLEIELGFAPHKGWLDVVRGAAHGGEAGNREVRE